MNNLRKASWAGSSTAINEPGSACFQGLPLLPKSLQRIQGNTPPKVISDWWSVIKR
jgi:hypothetical protein